MKVGLVSLGCAKNLVDSEAILALMKNNDFEIVSSPSEADVIIVNTCGFIESSKQESINTILEMASYNALLVVTGCLVQRYKEELEKELPEVDLFVPIRDYDKLGELISEKMKIKILHLYYDLMNLYGEYGNVRILESVELPKNPVAPNKKMNIAIAFILGMMVGFGIVFLLEYLDNTYKNKEQLEKDLDIPVLGVIPMSDLD